MRGATRAPDTFIDLICGDDELVRAEFDALIRECWPGDPPGPPPHPPASHPRGTYRPRGSAPAPAITRAPAARHIASQRAPPGRPKPSHPDLPYPGLDQVGDQKPMVALDTGGRSRWTPG
ncbi:hypothetical protein [Actinocrinis sp.]|uniref:hypothetical protein n=1 Tax=Actinocrinis sp. TaxID=1920516 RepID=UPI002D5A9651|nr:hypothetical protein [Actinocrinis sp.]HZP51976.1 hypothetical protein [Actinocrinis sp.]